MIELSNRLMTIAETVKPAGCICDIGTDHAYIPIYLVQTGKIKTAVASDVRKGPCDIARKNVEINNVSDRIEVRLGNGLNTVRPDECCGAILAGMGGILIKNILSDSHEIVSKMEQLVLQPQNSFDILRKYLYSAGFEIEDEKMVSEANKLYFIISAKYTGKSRILPEINYFIGEKLISNNDPLLPVYLKSEISRITSVLEEMKTKVTDNNSQKIKYTYLLYNYKKILKGIEA